MKCDIFFVVSLTAIALLGGCATQKDSMVKQGYPLAYAEGFDDGCHSGHKAGGNLFEQFKKDVRRFERSREYAQGWSDGFRQCESEQEAIQRQTRIGIEQQKLIEQRRQMEYQDQYHLEREVLKSIDTKKLNSLK